ncbi:unnamed protein product, partial [Brassica napus]
YRCGPPPEFPLAAPLRHSSPSFGSRQACSHSNPSQKIKVGRLCTREGSSQSDSLRLTDGSNGSPQADALRARRCRGTPRRVLQTIKSATSPRA